MLTEDLKKQIQQAYRAFLDAKGLKSRYGQRQMVAAVARVIGGVEADASGVRQSQGHVVLVEAGTTRRFSLCISTMRPRARPTWSAGCSRASRLL